MKPPRLADIDVMALRGKWRDPDTVLVLAGCKRNASRHQPARLDAQFSAFLEDLGTGDTPTRLRALPQERFLVSPEFTDEQRLKAHRAGYSCLGIRDLAHMLNIDPGPGQESRTDPRPAPAAPTPRKVPEPKDGSSMDMWRKSEAVAGATCAVGLKSQGQQLNVPGAGSRVQFGQGLR